MLSLQRVLVVMLHATLSLFVARASAQAAPPATPYTAAPASSEQPAKADPSTTASDVTPTPPHDERKDLVAELMRVEKKLPGVEANRDRHGIGGPVSMIVVGSALGAAYGIVAFATYSARRDAQDDIDEGYYGDSSDREVDQKVARDLRLMTIASSVGAVAHIGMAAMGIWWLRRRLNVRQHLDRELYDLEIERRMLRLKLDLSAAATGAIGQVTVRF